MPHVPDTVPGKRVTGAGARTEGREASRQTSEVGAVCGQAARTVLCGGRPVMGVPTAIGMRPSSCSSQGFMAATSGRDSTSRAFLRSSAERPRMRDRRRRDPHAMPARCLPRLRPSSANTPPHRRRGWQLNDVGRAASWPLPAAPMTAETDRRHRGMRRWSSRPRGQPVG